MAVTTYKDIYGWETGSTYGMGNSGGSAAQQWILDGTANTGCYYGKCLLRSAGAYNFTRTYGTALQLANSATSSFEMKARLYMRLATAPNQNQAAVLDLGNGASALPIDMVMRVNTDRSWEIYNNFAIPATVTGGAALPLNSWFPVLATFTWQRKDIGAGLKDYVALSITANAITLSTSLIFTNLLGSQPRVDRIGLGGGVFNGVSGLTVGECHYDDLTLMMQGDTTQASASVVLPTADRIRLVPVLGQGSLAAWTGSYTTVQEVPLVDPGTGQTSASGGAVTTFSHSTAAELGIASIDAFKVYGHMKASIAGPTTQQIRLNGTNYPVDISNIYQSSINTPMAVDWSSYSAAQFDAAEFGAVNSTGASLTLGAIHGEVLYTPGASQWYGCNAPSGVDPSYTPTSPGACSADMGNGADSGGGAGCSAQLGVGADSGGGSGCAVTL